MRRLWVVRLCHKLGAFYKTDPEAIQRTWSRRKCEILERFCERDAWQAARMRLLLAGGKSKEEEPDWFNCHYRLPIDPNASFEERMRQWNERVKPVADAACRNRENLSRGRG